jgi:hypothetical protein
MALGENQEIRFPFSDRIENIAGRPRLKRQRWAWKTMRRLSNDTK